MTDNCAINLDQLPRKHDGDYCPVCTMPLIRGECVRHDTEEMIAWGTKFRRDRDAARAELAEAVALLRDARPSLAHFVGISASARLYSIDAFIDKQEKHQ